MVSLSYEPLTYDQLPDEIRPTRRQAIVPVLGMLAFLSVGVIALDMDPHMPLIWGATLTGLVGRYWIGRSWATMYEGIVDGLRMGMQAILILFVVYMLIATWISAGTIPSLIYYGLDLLTPQIFLPITAVLAFIVAFTVGSSWTTAGTLGVAFIGIGTGLGVPEPMTAGAVLSGAYTGDKVSPLSDTTNLAAAVTNTDLMDHVSAMRVGTGLAFGIAVVGYVVLGVRAAGAIPAGQLTTIQSAITQSFVVSPLTFLPVVATFALALRGYPAIPSLTAGVFAGAATAIGLQGYSFGEAWGIAQSGIDPSTGTEAVNELLAAGGLQGSIWVISLVVIALSMGGLLERTGILAVLAHWLADAVQGVGSLTLGTAISAFGMNVLAAEQYMSIVVPGLTLRNLYDEYDLDSRNLSRAIESAGTTTSALVPWSTGGIYMAGVLGVPVLQYAPYYFLGILSPIVLVVMGVTGWRMVGTDETAAAGPTIEAGPTATAADDD